MYSIPRAQQDTPLGPYWEPAGRSKASSTFDSKVRCESAKQTTLAQFRSRQGTYEKAEGKTIIKVEGEIIGMIAQFKDGKGDSEQEIQLFCLDKDPPKKE
jgi:hypothetical protein